MNIVLAALRWLSTFLCIGDIDPSVSVVPKDALLSLYIAGVPTATLITAMTIKNPNSVELYITCFSQIQKYPPI